MRQLPPVHRAVPLRDHDAPGARADLQRHFGDRSAFLCGSGTQALAAAILAARDRRGLAATPGFEVIVPAYGCPDLVAACVFAGARARLVDTAMGGWGYDSRALREAAGPRTAAILAVNLLGVGDDAASIASIAETRGIPLIHDSAQSFPLEPRRDWPGEFVVLSFGRGKPINLLGGGALLCAPGASPSAALKGKRDLRRRVLSSALAAAAFNVLTHPAVYPVISALPGLKVGATRYHALQGIESWEGAAAWGRVGAGVAAYLADARRGEEMWRAMLGELRAVGVEPLLSQSAEGWNDRLLRLPLLMPDRERRDRLVDRLQSLGASAMYALPLPQIENVPEEVRVQGPFPHASRLADRLLTLPTHGYVTGADVAQVTRTILDTLRQ